MRAAVLGGGYAGVALARRLSSSLPAEAELVVVDESGTHLVQHELHRLVRRPELVDQLEIPLGDLLGGATVREASVAEVDPDGGVATLAGGEELAYDAGAVCLGAETAFYGIEGVREHATPLKRVEHAAAIREGFLDLPADGRVVVGGAGLSGVQVAGELAALADERGVDPRITLLEQEPAVAPGFPANFQAAIRAALEERGVVVRTGRRVVGADDAAIELAGGDVVEHDQFVWTGGIAGTAAAGGERPVVRADLRLGERTFGVGDAVRVIDADGEAVPASAQAAIREAKVAATNVRRLLDGGDGVFGPRLARFDFESPGWVVSVGDGAVAQVGPTVLTGGPAKALKASVGAGYLTGMGAIEQALGVVNEELGLADSDPPPDVDWPA